MSTASLTAPPAVRCGVTAHAVLRLPADALPALRRPPNPRTGDLYPISLLKNADEQTVAALAAVSEAIRTYGLTAVDFTDWGVVAAPRFLGRAMMAQTLPRFRQEGAWGISPHLIPNRSLHSVSGTLSLALAVHGPNFGVGGGVAAESEGLTTAAALVAGGNLPGVWAVLTGYSPELAPAMPQAPAPETPSGPAPACVAVALALTAEPGTGDWQILVGPAEDRPRAAADAQLTLDALADALTAKTAGVWRLGCGGWLELARVAAENSL